MQSCFDRASNIDVIIGVVHILLCVRHWWSSLRNRPTSQWSIRPKLHHSYESMVDRRIGLRLVHYDAQDQYSIVPPPVMRQEGPSIYHMGGYQRRHYVQFILLFPYHFPMPACGMVLEPVWCSSYSERRDWPLHYRSYGRGHDIYA